MVITFNYKDGTDTITFGDLKSALAEQKIGSDLDCFTALGWSKLLLAPTFFAKSQCPLMSLLLPSKSQRWRRLRTKRQVPFHAVRIAGRGCFLSVRSIRFTLAVALLSLPKQSRIVRMRSTSTGKSSHALSPLDAVGLGGIAKRTPFSHTAASKHPTKHRRSQSCPFRHVFHPG